MDKIVLGNYIAELDKGFHAWNIFYNNELLSVTPKEIWDVDTIAFDSKEAGEALLATAVDIYSPMETIIKKAIDADASLFKTPEDETENANPETGLPEENSKPDESTIIILKIQALVNIAKITKDAGGNPDGIFAIIDSLIKKADEINLNERTHNPQFKEHWSGGQDIKPHYMNSEKARHLNLNHPYKPMSEFNPECGFCKEDGPGNWPPPYSNAPFYTPAEKLAIMTNLLKKLNKKANN